MNWMGYYWCPGSFKHTSNSLTSPYGQQSICVYMEIGYDDGFAAHEYDSGPYGAAY